MLVPNTRLWKILTERRLKQKDLAEMTGIPFQVISSLVTGRMNATPEEEKKIEKALNEKGLFPVIQALDNDEMKVLKEFREQATSYNKKAS